jgi:cytochrome P450
MTTAEPLVFPFSAVELDPEPLFAELREGQPLCRVRLPYGDPGWLATRYEDVKAVLSDRRFSRAAALGHDEPRVRPNKGIPGNILGLDPPEHSRLRRVASKAFTIKRVGELRARTTATASALVDQMVERGGPADFVESFALPLPTTVICELLGVPVADRARFRTWTDAVMSTTRYTGEQVRDYHSQLEQYVAGLIAERRREPTDDLIGTLVAARDQEDRLREEELLLLVLTLLVAGHETTASQLGNFLYVLLTHPEQLAQIRADYDLIPRAVEELMRYIPLGYGAALARYALEDIELGGVTVRAGEAVIANMMSANRDEAAYSHPDKLDLRRAETSHFGFGHGLHTCLGAPLARMELQVTLRVLLDRLPKLRLAGPDHEIVWKAGVATRGPERLPVVWD